MSTYTIPNAIRNKWNAKYRLRPLKAREPEAYVRKNIHYFKNGSLLDFGCGDGRNTLFMARAGWNTTGADISEEGLKRMTLLAEKERNARGLDEYGSISLP